MKFYLLFRFLLVLLIVLFCFENANAGLKRIEYDFGIKLGTVSTIVFSQPIKQPRFDIAPEPKYVNVSGNRAGNFWPLLIPYMELSNNEYVSLVVEVYLQRFTMRRKDILVTGQFLLESGNKYRDPVAAGGERSRISNLENDDAWRAMEDFTVDFQYITVPILVKINVKKKYFINSGLGIGFIARRNKNLKVRGLKYNRFKVDDRFPNAPRAGKLEDSTRQFVDFDEHFERFNMDYQLGFGYQHTWKIKRKIEQKDSPEKKLEQLRPKSKIFYGPLEPQRPEVKDDTPETDFQFNPPNDVEESATGDEETSENVLENSKNTEPNGLENEEASESDEKIDEKKKPSEQGSETVNTKDKDSETQASSSEKKFDSRYGQFYRKLGGEDSTEPLGNNLAEVKKSAEKSLDQAKNIEPEYKVTNLTFSMEFRTIVSLPNIEKGDMWTTKFLSFMFTSGFKF